MPRGMAMDEMYKEEYTVMNNVRKEIWNKGIYGYALGSSSAVLLHTAANLVNRYRTLPVALNRNTLLASFFLGGTMGSFVLATVAGKNNSHNLHPIFAKGANPPPAKSYVEIREEASTQAWKDNVNSFERK